jgi:hypothetical protein
MSDKPGIYSGLQAKGVTLWDRTQQTHPIAMIWSKVKASLRSARSPRTHPDLKSLSSANRCANSLPRRRQLVLPQTSTVLFKLR